MAKNTQASKELSKRIRTLLIDRGWNQSELARRAAKFMPDGKFGRDNVSKYLSGPTLPTPLHLNALSKAFAVDPETLLPGQLLATDMDANTPLEIKQEGSGRAWVRLNQGMSMDAALKIAAIVQAERK